LVSGTATISNASVSGSTVTGVPVGGSATLRWTISNGVCTPSSDDVILTNYQAPTISDAGLDQSNCGTNASLNGNAPVTGIGSWTIVSGIGGNVAVPTSRTSLFTGIAGTTYILRWTIVNGVCSSQDDVQIILKRVPDVAASGKTICSYENVNIGITNPNGVPGTTFSWVIISPNNITGASAGNGSTISQSLHSTDGITQGQVVYRVTPIADGCPGNYIDITVYVNPIPVITNVASSLINSICSGITLNFTPSSSIGSTVMTWVSTNATSGTGAITETLVNSTSATQTVTYTITPSVGTCSGSPVNYVVEVKPLPSASGTNVIICSDAIAQINLSPSPKNVSGTSFVWTASPSGNFAGASNGNGSLISQTLTTTDASTGFVTYHITPTAFGCDGAVTDIIAQVNPKAIVNAGADYSVCEPASILVSGLIGGSASTGTWSIVKGDGTLSASSSGTTVTSTYTVAANDIIAGYITLRLTTNDPDGAQPCSLLFDDIRIDIHKKATVNVPADYTVCEPSQINLLGTVGGGAIAGTWSVVSGNGTLSVSSVTVNGTSKDVTAIYYPNVTDVNTVVRFRLTTDDPDGPGVSGPCVNESADLKITINKSAKVNAGIDFEVCEDGYVQLNASYSGATSSVTWSESSHTGTAQFSDITSVNSKYFLRPGIDAGSITFTLTTNDPDGSGPGGPCTNQSDDVVVVINKLPTVALTNLNSIYQEDDAIVTMAGFPAGAGGVFTGPGVIAGTNKFDPANANIGLNTITYTFTDSKSCTNSISKTITVNSLTTIDFGIVTPGSPINNGIGLPEIEICANIGIARLRGMPKYTEGLTPTVDTYFKGVISTPLIIVGLDASGYYINTDGLVSGEYYIQYTFKDAVTTATSSLTKKIIIKEAPVAIIGATDHCIDSPVQFTDLSTPSAIIDTWTWDFDDSGTQSSLQNPIYDYSLTQPRSHIITLKVTTTQGCSNKTTKSIIIGSPPIPDFNWTKLCSGDATRFSNLSTIATGTINGYGWDFDDGNTTSVSSGAIIPADNNGNRTSGTYQDPKHEYDNFGDFNVTLSVSTAEGCVKTVTKRIYILKAPSIAVDGYYAESFTEDVSSWIKTDLSSSWIFDVPQGDVIDSAFTGNKVWWTGANTNKEAERSTYFNNESSDIIGPCLNLSTIKRPMISLNYWSDLQAGFDGVVVQYSTDGALTWKTIGDAGGAGIDWYTSKNLIASPGDQQNYAWSEVNSGWKNARFNLDQIPIEKRDTVVFRLAFGSDGSNPNIQDKIFNGFAFDDVYIGEKQRNVLVEHFTNIPTVSAATYLDNLYDFQTDPAQTTYKAESDFIKIQYHMGNPNKEDSIYKVNPFDPSARAFYYQASQPPFTVMDGILGYYGDDRDSLVLNGDHALLNSEVIDRRALEDPLFKLAVDFSALDESRLKASVAVTYIDSLNSYTNPVVFHAVLVESSIGSLRNVVKKLLPDVEGKLLPGPWQNGTQILIPLDYKMDVHITNPDGLYLVVFVQDKITGAVKQSFTVKAPRLVGPQVVGLPDEPFIAELQGLRIYPNPASHVINFEHGKLRGSYTWKMIDQRGVVVLSGKLENNLSEPQVVDVSGLANAMYIVVIGTENGSVIHEKIAVMNQH
jgi:PKD repeat protein